MPINYPVTDCLQTHLFNEQPTQLLAHKYVCGLPLPRLLPATLLSVLCNSVRPKADRHARVAYLSKMMIFLVPHSQFESSPICSRLAFLWLHVRSFHNVPNWGSTFTKLMQFFMRNRFISIPRYSSKLSTGRGCAC